MKEDGKMNFAYKNAELYVPDGVAAEEALKRTTHLGIGAHQDDLEIMAFHGVLECFGRSDRWFTGVTCTNGAGSPRSGLYAKYTDEEMQKVRRTEQNKAAAVGQYSAMIQLDYPSAVVKNPADAHLKEDLLQILKATRPEFVYTHNPADKHDTHVAILGSVIPALRALPPDQRPSRVYGCETWRDLDWLPDTDKVLLDVSGRDHLAAAVLAVFDSQIAGGKRYDLAAMARRTANATFFQSHATDTTTQLTFAMDLTPLVANPGLEVAAYVDGLIEKFKAETRAKLRAHPEK